MKKKDYKILSKLFLDKLIPENKKKIMPSFSEAVNIKNFYIKAKSYLPKKIFNEYLRILDNFKIDTKIENFSNDLPNLLSNYILIEYYCSKKVIKRLKVISKNN